MLAIMSQDGEQRGGGAVVDEGHGGATPPSGPRVKPRPHALFPREPGAGEEDRDIYYIAIQRKLPPAEAKRVGTKIEYAPKDFLADELPDWSAIYAAFGGGMYKVAAKNRGGKIHCWAPLGEGNWHYMAGRSKPLAAEDEMPEEETVPAAPAEPPPPQTPALDLGALLLGVMKMQQDAADRQASMTNQILAALLHREDHAAPAAAMVDPLAGVKLGVEVSKAAQPAVAPAPAAAVDPLAQMRGTIELVKQVQSLTPAASGGGSGGAAEAAEVSTIFNGLTSLVNGLKTSQPAPEPQPPAAQTKVLINGRLLTTEQAALEYSRLSAGPPVTPPVFSAGAAPPPQAPAVTSAPVVASAVASPPQDEMRAVVSAPAPAEIDVDEVLDRLRDPVFAEKLRARVESAQAAAVAQASPAPASSPRSAEPAAPPPSATLSSNVAPSPPGPPAVASPVTATLAMMPRELVGHLAELDPTQFVALARMHPEAIVQSVRGLPGMDEEKARMFGEAMGALPPEALPLLSRALPAEAKRVVGVGR